jgi:hypothetical protein
MQVCNVSVTGVLTPLHVLEHHKNLIHVLHCHPRFPRVCLSAGKDGLIRLFDFVTAESFQTTPMECEYVETSVAFAFSAQLSCDRVFVCRYLRLV